MTRRETDSGLLRRGCSRRDFLRALAALSGLTAAGALLEGCSPQAVQTPPTAPATPAPVSLAPTATPAPTTAPPTLTAAPTAVPTPTITVIPAATATATPLRSRVALVKTRDRADGVRQALDLLGVNPVRGEQVVVKPNFNSADPSPGSTHPDVLRTLVERLWGIGSRSITVADRSGMGDTRAVMERLGVPALARQLNFQTIVFDELDAAQWALIRPTESHWRQGFPFARPCLECGALVQTCNLKTHRFGGHFTLSLKNSVGMVAKTVPGAGYNYMTELHGSPHQRRMIAEINAAYQPALIVMDGVEAFVDGGPDTGKKVWSEVVLAATDRVAIDAVGVAILRMFGTTPAVSRGPIFELEQLARAVELGLGAASPDEIALVTGDPDSADYAARIHQVLTA